METEALIVRDSSLETIISALLRLGVLISAAVVLISGIFLLRNHAREAASASVFQEQPAYYRSLGGIVGRCRTGDSAAGVLLGLVILTATPVMRVMLCFAVFVARGDRRFIIVTGIVLCILFASLIRPL